MIAVVFPKCQQLCVHHHYPIGLPKDVCVVVQSVQPNLLEHLEGSEIIIECL